MSETLHPRERFRRTRLLAHEQVASERSHWIRLTRRCNNRCQFCHDAPNQDGAIVPVPQLRDEMARGRARGAGRLVLSGGEPTIHPDYLALVRAGRELGYDWVQTISNGRMFAYPRFVQGAVAAGLSEATVSLHGDTPALHDRLVGVPGAFEQTVRGLRNLLDAGLVVSVDVVVCRPNLDRLAAILRVALELGVREFDLLHLVPFGRAFSTRGQQLFFTADELRAPLAEALQLVDDREDVHLWTNRWPAAELEGAEHLIQDPYKIADEVRGRWRSLAEFLGDGEGPACRGPRCDHCFMQGFCATLLAWQRCLHEGGYEAVALDATAVEQQQEITSAALARQATPCLRLHAESATALAATLQRLALAPEVALELAGSALLRLPEALRARVRRALVTTPAELEAALDLPQALLELPLARANLPLLPTALERAPSRVIVTQPGRRLVREVLELDLAPAEIRSALAGTAARGEGVPPCLGLAESKPARRVLELAMLDRDGRIDLDAFVDAFVRDHQRVHALRCARCADRAACAGAQLNQVRVHGFAWMEPRASGADGANHGAVAGGGGGV